MAQLLCALEDNTEPEISGRDNLKTMALVEACYRSAKEHRAVAISEITRGRRPREIGFRRMRLVGWAKRSAAHQIAVSLSPVD